MSLTASVGARAPITIVLQYTIAQARILEPLTNPTGLRPPDRGFRHNVVFLNSGSARSYSLSLRTGCLKKTVQIRLTDACQSLRTSIFVCSKRDLGTLQRAYHDRQSRRGQSSLPFFDAVARPAHEHLHLGIGFATLLTRCKHIAQT